MKTTARFYIYTLVLVASISCFSCEDVIEVDIPQRASRLVVNGWVYDHQDIQTIVLNRSTAYLDGQPLPPVTKAQVRVAASSGETFEYTEEAEGTYQSKFRGLPGKTYTLTVETADGQRYASTPQQMNAPVPLDSVYVQFQEASVDDDEEEDGYYPTWDITDPPSVENYYRWRVYVDGTLLSASDGLLIASDEFVDGESISEIQFFGMDPLVIGDEVTIEQLAITEQAYNFLEQVEALTSNVGGLFDTPPGPVEGNITNTTDKADYALGFFGTAAVSRESVVVAE